MKYITAFLAIVGWRFIADKALGLSSQIAFFSGVLISFLILMAWPDKRNGGA